MAFRDLIPWRSRSGAPAERESDSPFFALQREMNDLFDNFFSSWDEAPARRFGAFSPSIDIDENDEAYTLTAEVPGLEKDDIDLELHGDFLTLKGEKREEKDEKKGACVYRERSVGRFERTIPVGSNIDREKIDAAFKNGVLTVTLPKTSEAKSAQKRIPVKSA